MKIILIFKRSKNKVIFIVKAKNCVCEKTLVLYIVHKKTAKDLNNPVALNPWQSNNPSQGSPKTTQNHRWLYYDS